MAAIQNLLGLVDDAAKFIAKNGDDIVKTVAPASDDIAKTVSIFGDDAAKGVTSCIKDAGFGVRKSIIPQNLQELKYAPDMMGDTVQIADKSDSFLKELADKLKNATSTNHDSYINTPDEVDDFIKWLQSDEKNIQLAKKYKDACFYDTIGEIFEIVPIDCKSRRHTLELLKDKRMEDVLDLILNTKTPNVNGTMSTNFDGLFYAFDLNEYLEFCSKNIDDIDLIKSVLSRKTTDHFNLSSSNIIPVLADLEEILPKLKENKLAKKLFDLKINEVDSLLSLKQINNIENLYPAHNELIEKMLNDKKLTPLLKCMDSSNIEYFYDEKILKVLSNNYMKNMDYICFKGYDKFLRFETGIGAKRKKEIYFDILNSGELKFRQSELIENLPNNAVRCTKIDANGRKVVEEISRDRYFTPQSEWEFLDIYQPGVARPYGMTSVNTKILDGADNVIKVRNIKESQVAGEYLVDVTENGVKRTAGTVQQYGANSQGLKVQHNFTSPNGTTSSRRIIEGPRGKALDYIIKDKDGNILSSVTRRFRKLDDNHFISEVNGQKFDMRFDGNSVTVSKLGLNGEILDTIVYNEDVLTPELKELYKKMPGDHFSNLKEMGIKKVFEERAIKEHRRCSHYNYADNEIMQGFGDNGFIFAHEIGHGIDEKVLGQLRNDSEFLEIYNREIVRLEEAFSSSIKNDFIKYFTPSSRGGLGGNGETVAEIVALLSGERHTQFNVLGPRSLMIEEYMPETIAYVAKKLYS